MKLSSEELLRDIATHRSAIVAKTTEDDLIESEPLKRLIATLIAFSERVSAKAFVFHLTKDHIEKLNFSEIDKNLDHIAEKLKHHNFFLVDNNFEVSNEKTYNPVNTEEAQNTFKKLSKNNHCVILILNGLHSTFFNQVQNGSTTFLAEADLKRYDEKMDLSDLNIVLDEYRTQLNDHNHVYKFFVEKSTLVRIFGDSKYIKNKNLLRNSPEDALRVDLRDFLSQRIRRTFNFSKENMLDSKKRMDINTEDELGNYYFFEIKWLGKSIDKTGNKVTTSFGVSSVPDGYRQTLNYIKELTIAKKTVRSGYLIIFDARSRRSSLDHCFHDSHLEAEHKKFKNQFTKTKPFTIENTTPR